MNKDFVPHEESLELKELGFDEPCFAVYSEHDKTRVYEESSIVEGLKIQAPLYQQAFRWFREKHDLPSEVRFVANLEVYDYRITKIGTEYTNAFYEGVRPASAFSTYEEAELACLRKLIEIVKNNE
jgi:hypothetical protein